VAPPPAEDGARPGQDDEGGAAPLELVRRLCEALAAEGIRYCHWKSTAALDRAARGESDLDLLVARADADRFEGILRALGFKDARTPPDGPPGVFHAYGLDGPSGSLVQLHVHYRLVVGDDTTKNHRLPIEDAYLGSSVRGPLFRVPDPAFEFVVLVLRMVLKHGTWDAIASGKGRLSPGERRELAFLTARTDRGRVGDVVRTHLPFVGEELFERCHRSLRPGAGAWSRIRTARRLELALAAHARRSPRLDPFVRLWRRGRVAARRRVAGRGRPPGRLARGGAWIAVVGADGAGKTTAVEELDAWLGRHLDVRRVHLGKPPRSVASLLAHGAWRGGVRRLGEPGAGDGPGGLRDGERIGPRALAKLVRKVMVSRDRALGYVRGARFVARGGIVISDRFPIARIRSMDGPATAALPRLREGSAVVRALARLEDRAYRRIGLPDVLVVLRVDPETAVERRRGIEPEDVVRRRAAEIAELDWEDLGAVVVDPTRPRDEVRAAIRSAVWARL
jgi:thymidylate kinase